MTDGELPVPTSPSEERIVRDVREHGWHVVHVLEDETTPGWSYTIGLHHDFGHPELLFFGLDPSTAHAVLNVAGDAVRSGRPFEADVPYGDLLEGHACTLRPVSPLWYGALVGRALWFYGGPRFPLLQLFWPDRQGVLPWEDGAADWLRAAQPLLYEDSASGARLEAVLASMDPSDG